MLRDYQIKSPSLEGILHHASVSYDGIERPTELLRALDGPAAKGNSDKEKMPPTQKEQKVLEEYFHDLYGIFMKRLSFFVVESESSDEDTLKLQAMLQEMVKIKKLMAAGKEKV